MILDSAELPGAELPRQSDDYEFSPDASFFGVRIGQLGLLISADIHCEVMEPAPLAPIPNTRSWLSGLINLRGNLVPVFDLHKLLGNDVDDPRKRRLFTLDKGERTAAIWIDGLPQVCVCRQPMPTIPPAPALLAPYLRAAHAMNGQTWFQVDPRELFETLGRQVAVS